ncbi:hypothetical protein nbrc107696_14100 [Gordonia spumicola]|uniref:Uncharacterized protein n=1 Tax=Gordonia spumicola TaxID=589161 RepID=A0A7I9V6V9_9ACTN|nr:hypothetical protein [Gordonia spumicola]GEE00964.1 hypothetical protein nbrc107696_14100 [Gordonia spumicola]
MSTDQRKSAALHVGVTFAIGFVLLAIAVNTTGTVNTAFLIAGPVAVGLCTVAAMARTVLAWRANDGWQVWQGASIFLLATTVVWVFGAVPALVA